MLILVMAPVDGIWRPPEAGSAAAPTAAEQHLVRRHAQREAQRAVAIVRVKPVVPGCAAPFPPPPESPHDRRR